MSRFPAAPYSKQMKDVKSCCLDNLKPWDCGCSWGCDMCYVTHRCDVCRACYGASAKETIDFRREKRDEALKNQ